MHLVHVLNVKRHEISRFVQETSTAEKIMIFNNNFMYSSEIKLRP